MFPKIGPTGSRFLETPKAPERPGETINSNKASKGDDGGYGVLAYTGEDSHSNPDSQDSKKEEQAKEAPQEKTSSLEFSPGLTQVILDLNSSRTHFLRGQNSKSKNNYQGHQDSSVDPEKSIGSKLDQKIS